MIAIDRDGNNEHALTDLAVDLTPMLDILFILLVFFLLTAGTVLQSLELELPTSVAEDTAPLDAPRHILLQVKRDGYKLDGRDLAGFEDLKAALPEAVRDGAGRQLIIASDRRVEADRLLGVLTHLQSVGIAAANILLNRENVK